MIYQAKTNIKTLQSRIKSLQKLLHHVSEEKKELKPRFNHLHKLVSLTLSFLKIYASLKTILTVLADGDGWRDINSFEKNTGSLFIYFPSGSKMFKTNPVSVDQSHISK